MYKIQLFTIKQKKIKIKQNTTKNIDNGFI